MRAPGARWALLVALLAGCAGLPDRLDECRNDLCRQSWLSRAVDADPLAAAREVGALGDPKVAAAFVELVAHQEPEATGQVCTTLPPRLAEAACRQGPSREDSTAARSAPGEALPSLTPPDSSAVNPASLRAPALEACQALADPMAAARCRYDAATRAADAASASTMGEATTLCLTAGPYISQCLLRVVFAVAALAPGAGSADAQAWEGLRTAIDGSAAAMPDPEFRERWRQQLWGGALRSSYEATRAPNAAPLAWLPEEAAPHLRAALAWRLWALEPTPPRAPGEWRARLAEALAVRDPAGASGAQRQRSGLVRELWSEVLPGEEALPRLTLFVGASRTTSPDPTTDALLALLEAAARSSPPGKDLLSAALTDEDASVRWTAARLLGALDPGRRLRHVAFDDPDPLVAARARYRRAQGP